MASNNNNMTVAVRVRPLSSKETSTGHKGCCDVVGSQVVTIVKAGDKSGPLPSQRGSTNEYAFDQAFGPSSSQLEIYEKTVKSLIPQVLDGFNATVFAYGATGAGKTHTMMGSERGDDASKNETEGEVDGIIPHALQDIFRLLESHRHADSAKREATGETSSWKVMVSYLEVYNEQIRDLLEPSRRALSLREDPSKGIVHVAGLHHAETEGAEEVMDLLRIGNRNRKTESTAVNSVSSRSHAVLQVSVIHTVTQPLSSSTGAATESITEGKLSLIDLAGSERASATQNRGIRMTEGANINRSLLALANCINALASNTSKRKVSRRQSDIFSMSKMKAKFMAVSSGPKVQYRDSKLTHLLKSSLEGDCRLVMIANINPSHQSYEESHNTLKYANRAKNIKIRPKMHVVTAELTHQERAAKLEKENIELRELLVDARRRKVKGDDDAMMVVTEFGDDDNTVDFATVKIENRGLQFENASLTEECKRLRAKVSSLEARVQELQGGKKQAPLRSSNTTTTPTAAVRRSSRRKSMAVMTLTPVPEHSSTNENSMPEDENVVSAKKKSGNASSSKKKKKSTASRRKSMIPMPTKSKIPKKAKTPKKSSKKALTKSKTTTVVVKTPKKKKTPAKKRLSLSAIF